MKGLRMFLNWKMRVYKVEAQMTLIKRAKVSRLLQ